eukprot:365010-Chlamydomonas_euryale.AAC.7
MYVFAPQQPSSRLGASAPPQPDAKHMVWATALVAHSLQRQQLDRTASLSSLATLCVTACHRAKASVPRP